MTADTETFGFTFDGEAGESFQTAVQKFIGWTVRITTETGEEFDAMIESADHDGAYYNDVVVQRVSEGAERVLIGEPFTVTVRNIHVY